MDSNPRFAVGENDNNILLVVGTQGATNQLEFSSRYNQKINGRATKDYIYEKELTKIKIEVIDLKDKYVIKTYKDNENFMNQILDTNEFIRNISRTSNYLGKSNWAREIDLFHGYIYSLKITDSHNKIILWYDF